MKRKKLAILASGNGSGFEAIYQSIQKGELLLSCEVVISNNSDAKVLQKAKKFGIDSYIVNKTHFYEYENEHKALEEILMKYQCDYIFLSGYMKMIPQVLTSKYKNKIINSHPSLLPKYGGKGMYGRFVHEAVLQNNETTTGVSVHFVNEIYDEGKMILQEMIQVDPSDTIVTLEQKVKKLEQKVIIKSFQKIL